MSFRKLIRKRFGMRMRTYQAPRPAVSYVLLPGPLKMTRWLLRGDALVIPLVKADPDGIGKVNGPQAVNACGPWGNAGPWATRGRAGRGR